jgi:outer membrane protein assembly factor BamB
MLLSFRLATAFAALGMMLPSLSAADWPQWLGPNRDGVWSETGIIDNFPPEGPKVFWRTPIAGGYSGPAVGDGKVYVMDYAAKGDAPKEGARADVKGEERVLCLSAATGEVLWKHRYDCPYTISYPAGPRATPTVADGKVYSLGAEGNLFCLDAAKGTVLWSKDFKKDYNAKTPMWGFCSHPLVDGKKVVCIVGGENACVVAFDKDNGKELWKALNAEEPGYSCPSMIEAGGVRQLIVWHSASVNSLDPETGTKNWSVPLSPDYKMSIMAPRKYGEYLFAAGIGDKALLLKLASDKAAATEVWRGTKANALYPVNMTPFIENDTIYGVSQNGQLMAVDLKTAERKWETTQPVTGKDSRETRTGTAFLVKNGDRFFLFNEKGELVIAKLSPEKYEEIGRAQILAPTGKAFGRDVVWSHPAFANKCVFARNDKEIVCFSLAK